MYDNDRYCFEKSKLQEMNLTPKEYEQAVRLLDKLCSGKEKSW